MAIHRQLKKGTMKKKEERGMIMLNTPMIKFIMIILGVATSYFLSIQSIKVDLAAKAEMKTVEILDKKLTNIEYILNQGVLSKEQFYQFSQKIDHRLSRIEFLLENKKGAEVGKN